MVWAPRRLAQASVRSGGAPETATPIPGPRDLLIVGAGDLGRRIARQWREEHPDARVVGSTLTTASHPDLRTLGVEPRTVQELSATVPREVFPYVVFSVPPRAGSPQEYLEAVAGALAHWSHPIGAGPPGDVDDGAFVFTSSGGVLEEDGGGVVDESSPVAGRSPLVEAEEVVRRAGGTALRLAGLYDVDRGAHAYWLRVGAMKTNPAKLINLVHYDDGASAVVSALDRGASVRGELFLVSDGSPMTPTAIVGAALEAPPYKGLDPPALELGSSHGLGKIFDVRRTQKALSWTPRYPSFSHFMRLQR